MHRAPQRTTVNNGKFNTYSSRYFAPANYPHLYDSINETRQTSFSKLEI